MNDFVELDGPASLRVVFPSGREVSGTFGRGALGMTAQTPTPGSESAVINEVILLESPVTTAEVLREAADAFVAEWGPASFRETELDDFLDAFDAFMASAEDPVDFNDFAPIGENVFAFAAEPQDGVEAFWGARVTFDSITIRVVQKFDPGVP